MSKAKFEDLRFAIYINNNQAAKSLIELDEKSVKLQNSLNDLVKSGKHETQEYKEKKEALQKVISEKKELDRRSKELTVSMQKLIQEGKLETQEFKNLKIENDKLISSKSLLSKQIKVLNSDIEKLKNEGRTETDEFKKLDAELSEHKLKLQGLRKEAGLSALSMHELTLMQKELRLQMNKTIPGSEQRIKLQNEYNQVTKRINELNSEGKKQESIFSKLANFFNKYSQMLFGLSAMFAGLGFAIHKIIKGNTELSDSFADVARSTNLSIGEVRTLYSSFSNFNTRTAKKELIEFAYIAGKLGITGVDNISRFVKAADQINVVLGKELGGNAEEVINDLGKITDIFGIQKEFGIEKSMTNVGSALISLGQASTASEGNIVEFTKRLGGVGPLAGVSVQNVMGLGASLDQLGQHTETAGTAMSNVFIAMGKRTDVFAKLAGQNLQSFSKLLKDDANAALIAVLKGLKNNSSGVQKLAMAMEDLKLEGSRSIGVIGVLANNLDILQKNQTIANKEFASGTSIVEQFNLKNDTLAGDLSKIGKYFHSFFINSTLNTWLNDVVNNIARWTEIPLTKVIEDEGKKVNMLVSELYDANTSTERRKKLLEELKSINPDIVKGLNSENIEYNTLTKNVERYNEQLINRIVIQKQQDKLDENSEKIAELKIRRLKAETDIREQLLKFKAQWEKDSKIAIGTLGKDPISAMDVDLYEKLAKPAIMYLGILNSTNLSFAEKINSLLANHFTPLQQYVISYQFILDDLKALDTHQQILMYEKRQLLSDLGISESNISSVNQTNNTDNRKQDIIDENSFDIKQTEDKNKQKFLSEEELQERLYKLREQFNMLELEQMQAHAIELLENDPAYDLMSMEEQEMAKVLTLEKFNSIKISIDELNHQNYQTQLEDELNMLTDSDIAKQNLEYESFLYKQQLYNETYEGKRALIEAELISEEEKADKLKALDKEVLYAKLETTQFIFSNIASIFKKHTLAYKISASAIALIDTYKSANEAYAAMAGILGVGPVLAAIAAASAIAAGLANVAAINKVKGFKLGGPTGQGGIVHENEYVIPAWERQIPQVMHMESIIEAIRTRGSIYNNNSISSNNYTTQKADPLTLQLLKDISDKLDNPTRSYIVFQDLEDTNNKINKIRNLVS